MADEPNEYAECERGHLWAPSADTGETCPICESSRVEREAVPRRPRQSVVFRVLTGCLCLGVALALPVVQNGMDLGDLPSFAAALAPVALIGMLAIAGIVWFQSTQSGRRDRHWASTIQPAADRLSGHYAPELSQEMSRLCREFPMFRLGDEQEVGNVVQFVEGDQEALAARLTWTTTSRKSRTTTSRFVVVYPNAAPGLPAFELEPESYFDKFGQMFGAEDVDFTDTAIGERFSSAYRLRGASKEELRTVFRENVLEYFAHELRWHVQSAEGHLLFSRDEEMVSWQMTVNIGPPSTDDVVRLVEQSQAVRGLLLPET